MSKKMIMIPEDQYLKMLESYDEAVKELEEIKKLLKSWQTIQEHSNPTTTDKSRILS